MVRDNYECLRDHPRDHHNSRRRYTPVHVDIVIGALQAPKKFLYDTTAIGQVRGRKKSGKGGGTGGRGASSKGAGGKGAGGKGAGGKGAGGRGAGGKGGKCGKKCRQKMLAK